MLIKKNAGHITKWTYWRKETLESHATSYLDRKQNIEQYQRNFWTPTMGGICHMVNADSIAPDQPAQPNLLT